jgi:hypothetical protein
MSQTYLFPETSDNGPGTDAASSTFADNLRLPVHRWIRYSAGFSGAWAEYVIRDFARRQETRVLDPFAGSGTTLIAAEDVGVRAYGVESHPFVYRLARAKLARRSSIDEFRALITTIRSLASEKTADLTAYPKLIRACYTDQVLSDLDRLRQAIIEVGGNSDAGQLAWLALVAILRSCSHAGTAQWQYVLPRKNKKAPAHPFSAFHELTRKMIADMAEPLCSLAPRAMLLPADARSCEGVPDDFATLVLTSPPYPNNYDYADATRLEMSFLQEINGWGDLQSSVRRHLVRSCTQHVPERAASLENVLATPLLDPIRHEITNVCQQLSEVRLTKGGKKTYHLMIACYFYDLAHVWATLRRVCDSPSQVCFVIGDSAPYGVYVPVIDWLGKLALAAGFNSFRFERTRDRNIKWKNRKHRVPLCEGRLWVEG